MPAARHLPRPGRLAHVHLLDVERVGARVLGDAHDLAHPQLELGRLAAAAAAAAARGLCGLLLLGLGGGGRLLTGAKG